MDEAERLVVVAALAGPERARDAWRTWRETTRIEDATELLTWSAGYIHRNLAQAGVSDTYLAGIHRHNLIANSRRLVAALPFIRAISRRWSITPLKSFARTSIESRGLRPLADFDFHVDAEHLPEVRGFLQENGFRPLLDVDDVEFRTRIFRQRGSWNYLRPDDVDLDLHWRLFDHVDPEVNRRLIEDHTRVGETELGRVRLLDEEASFLLLVVHHVREGSGRKNLLFDAYHLLRQADPRRVAHLAESIGVARPVAEFVEEVRDLLGDDTHDSFDRLDAGIRAAAAREADPHARSRRGRLGSRTPGGARPSEFLAHPRLYAAWDALGQSRRLERLMARGGPVTGGEARPTDALDYPRGGGALGIGWHHRFPRDEFRWADLPEARVLLPAPAPDASSLVVELDAAAWREAHEPAVDVFAAGILLGRLTKDVAAARFALPHALAGAPLDVALRHVTDQRHRSPGIHQVWYNLLAPVHRIELR